MRVLNRLVLLVMALIIAACGGGGAATPATTTTTPGTGGGTTTTAVATLGVALSSTAVTSAAPSVVTATLKDASGAAIAGQVLTFSTAGNLGIFSATSALTDAAGGASVTLYPASTSTAGADNVVVKTTVGTTAVTAQVGFQLTATTAAVTTPSLVLGLSGTTVTAASPIVATATLKDAQGNGIAGKVLSFSTVNSLGSFSATTALTNAAGVASVRLSPASASTNGADEVVVSATVNGTSVSDRQGFQLTATNVSVASFTSDLSTGSSVSAYGQTNLTVVLSGAASGTAVSVAVSSVCVSKGKATLTPSTASTTNGTVSFTYRDNGCGATDASDALQASVVGSSANAAPLSLALTSPAVSSITFASATPQTIYLKGSGLTESSQVSFQVRDLAGNALPNQSVLLEPTTLTGGLALDGGAVNITKKSDSAGLVTAIVNSGTVPTPVRIKATLVGSSISTVSSSLAVAVGLPSQLNFSMSQGTLNIEGFNTDGVTNTYSIIASDRLGNPVPDGTAINFVSEGGQVQAIGLTTGNPSRGGVTVQFQSSAPRPDDGRITVLAYALGEESFLDTNGDNIYTMGEPFQDLGNIFLSRSYTSTYDSVVDQFISLALSGSSNCTAVDTAKDPLGLLSLNVSIPSISPPGSSVSGTCDGTWGRAYVRRAVETVLSTSGADPVWGSTRTGLTPGSAVTLRTSAAATTTTFARVDGSTLVGAGATGTLRFLVRDQNLVRLNPVAAGSTVAVLGSTGLTVSVLGGSPVPSSNDVTAAAVSYAFDTTTLSGTVTIQITSPRGLTTVIGVNLIK